VRVFVKCPNLTEKDRNDQVVILAVTLFIGELDVFESRDHRHIVLFRVRNPSQAMLSEDFGNTEPRFSDKLSHFPLDIPTST
jgi:hypothetical protein